MARNTLFNPKWIEQFNAQDWLKAGDAPNTAKCEICKVSFNVALSGSTSVKQHMATKKHTVSLFFQFPDNYNFTLYMPVTQLPNFGFQTLQISRQKNSAIQTFFQPQQIMQQEHTQLQVQTMKAEIRWVWHTAVTSKTFNAEDKTALLFQAMFPCPITEAFRCGRAKQVYLLNFAIAPHCRQTILEEMKGQFFSVAFDEADARMMIVVRYYSADGSIRTEMLDFVPMNGEFTAESCCNIIYSTVVENGLLVRNWIGDFSDKCNTMRGDFLYSIDFCYSHHFLPNYFSYYNMLLSILEIHRGVVK